MFCDTKGQKVWSLKVTENFGVFDLKKEDREAEEGRQAFEDFV